MKQLAHIISEVRKITLQIRLFMILSFTRRKLAEEIISDFTYDISQKFQFQ